ncbi:MAG: hypothetical protein NTZ49_02860 [Candidatus Parcubacteria bacterium]|nr:hypothetical protein [Candidatus Parcubacteria bacterium]
MKRKIEPKTLPAGTKIEPCADDKKTAKAKPVKKPFFAKDEKQMIICISILIFYVVFFAGLFSYARNHYSQPVAKELWERKPALNHTPVKIITKKKDIAILNTLGISDCRVKKIKDWTVNEITLVCNQTRYIVYCDTDAPYYTKCCYQTGN